MFSIYYQTKYKYFAIIPYRFHSAFVYASKG